MYNLLLSIHLAVVSIGWFEILTVGGVVVAGTVVVVGGTNAAVVVTSGVGVALSVGPQMKIKYQSFTK